MLGRSAASLLIVLACQSAAATAQTAANEWTVFRNDRFGFSLSYPADVFQLERTSDAGDGQVFLSRDGDARLLVGVLPNKDRLSPAGYQDYVARQSYPNFAISYRRVSGNWFVLSGEGNGKTFYEKVIFSCNGRLINSFAMIYPVERGAVFDRVVEGIEKTFRPATACEQDLRSTPNLSLPPQERSLARHTLPMRRDPHSPLADRIARSRGRDVLVVLRRTGPPYDYKIVRGFARQ